MGKFESDVRALVRSLGTRAPLIEWGVRIGKVWKGPILDPEPGDITLRASGQAVEDGIAWITASLRFQHGPVLSYDLVLTPEILSLANFSVEDYILSSLAHDIAGTFCAKVAKEV